MHRFTCALICCFVLSLSFAAQVPATDDAETLSREVAKLFSENKFKEALPIAAKVVELRRSAVGDRDISTGKAYRNLAYVQLGAGKTGDAIGSFEKAITIYSAQAALGDASRDELGSMLERLGYIRFDGGRDRDAIDLFTKAAEQRRIRYGENSIHTAGSVWALANVYFLTKDYKNAESNFWRVVLIRSVIDPWSWETADAEGRYLCTAKKNGNGEGLESKIRALKNSAAKTDETFRIINGGVVNGKAKYLRRPEYPVVARHAVPTGRVSVTVTIDETGKVIFACASDGNKVFWDAVEQAAYGSLFEPTTLEGKPVKVKGRIEYQFSY